MSEGEVLVSGGEASEAGEDILNELPSWMPRDESSGNFKLLDVVGRGFDRLEDDIADANDASNVQKAQTIGQLDQLSNLVGVSPKQDEPVEKYRRRVIAEFQNATNEGDLGGLMKNISVLLNIESEEIGYSKGTGSGTFILSVPGDSIDSASLTAAEFGDIITDQVAAGFRANIQSRGTFSYITSTQYNNNDHDATVGYDGLDSNGNPKDNGGTYAGVLN